MEASEFYNRQSARGWIVNGYRFIRTPDGREMLEHRYVVEQRLGRRLRPDEDVHHKNHNRLDNRDENLELIDHRAHVSLHQNEGGKRRPAVCPVCGGEFLRLSWRPDSTCSRHCGLVRMWRRRRAAA
jgi:predicted Zn-ribbon and HTH transcriptional regulator